MKKFNNIDNQIKLLESRNLRILNEEKAKENLKLYGYYEIVNGYKNLLLKDIDTYKDGVTFEHLFSLFKLDSDIKDIVLNIILEFEIILKNVLAYEISKKYGVIESEYLKRKNYKGKRFFIKDNSKVFHLDILLDKFNLIKNYNSQPFKHYRESHNHIPPWILFKGATFGNMYYFYMEQKAEVKNSVISTIFGVSIREIEEKNELKNLFADGIALVYQFRNRTAHGGRVYNFTTYREYIRFNRIFHNRSSISNKLYRFGYGKNDLFTFIKFFSFMPKHLNEKLNIEVRSILKDYLSKYPEDKNMLLTEIGVPTTIIELDLEKIFDVTMY